MLYAGLAFGQPAFGGRPPSFAYRQSGTLTLPDAKAEKTVKVNLYINDLLEVDAWRARLGTPLRVAECIAVDYDMDNSGAWSDLPDGGRIWLLKIKAAEARALMLCYKKFYIPKGAKLYIYNANRTQVLGAYTDETHPDGGVFATEFVAGDELTLEYVASAESNEKPIIHIDQIGYGYSKALNAGFIQTGEATGVCMVNVNCSEGDAWQNEKRGVCLLYQKIGSSYYLCSGTLLNNTAEDFKPLILTARHCGVGDRNNAASADDMNKWLFYFNLERRECSNSSETTVHKSFTGCRLLANTGMAGGSDGMLLLLNSQMSPDYNLYFNGWDRRDIAPQSGSDIHHPNGDYKKISTFSSAARSATFDATEFTGAANAHWTVSYVRTENGHGVTQAGSSGSPLFNQNKLVTGTLSGGTSVCMDAVSARGSDYFGKMSYHWNKFTADSSTRMDLWLDPLNTGVEQLQGRFMVAKSAPRNLSAINNVVNVVLNWDKPFDSGVAQYMSGRSREYIGRTDEPYLRRYIDEEAPVYYNIYREYIKIGSTSELTYTDVNPVAGANNYSVSAVYADGSESAFADVSLLFVQFNPPVQLTASRLAADPQRVELQWKEPVFEQNIYWGTMADDITIGFKDNNDFFFGQYWEPEDLTPLNNRTLTALRFLPVSGSSYPELLIQQGDETPYIQTIESSALHYETLSEIKLTVPFVINASRSLRVAVRGVKTDASVKWLPAICDEGPAIDGKGNVFSFDKITWYKLYNETKPDDYNFNFSVSAVVSSERGALPKRTAANTTSSLNFSNAEPLTDAIATVSARSSKTTDAVNNDTAAATAVSLRSSLPIAFPEISYYIIYCNDVEIGQTADGLTTTWTGVLSSTETLTFNVAAVYSGSVVGEKSNSFTLESLNTLSAEIKQGIVSTVFNDRIALRGYENISRIDAVDISGRLCLAVNHPQEFIDASSLAPGVYFFRIYVDGKVVKTVKAVKTR